MKKLIFKPILNWKRIFKRFYLTKNSSSKFKKIIFLNKRKPQTETNVSAWGYGVPIKPSVKETFRGTSNFWPSLLESRPHRERSLLTS